MGHYLEMEGFLSTTLSLEVAVSFSAQTIIKIVIPKETNLFMIKHPHLAPGYVSFTDKELLKSFGMPFDREEEVLFNPLHIFKVIGIEEVSFKNESDDVLKFPAVCLELIIPEQER